MKYNLIGFKILFLLFSCTSNEQKSLTIAVASSLLPVMGELVEEFQVETHCEINIVSGSSGKLTAQIEAGAPYNIFLSADTLYTNYLSLHLVLKFKPIVFASGKLVFLTDDNLQVNKSSYKTLFENNQLKKIAIPNPTLAPYGKAAKQALIKLDIEQSFFEKLIYAESISQSNQFLKSKAVNAGFTSLSSVYNKSLTKGYKVHLVPEKLYTPVLNTALIISDNEKHSSIKFLNFLKTHNASKILKKYGYTIP